MKSKTTILFLIICLSLTFCKKKDTYIACTKEFRFITITVNGYQLDEYYTIRKSTSDTIRYKDNDIWEDNQYVVLDDNYKSNFYGKQEEFVFYGFIDNKLQVKETFIIKADQCHINYVSGNQVVQIID